MSNSRLVTRGLDQHLGIWSMVWNSATSVGPVGFQEDIRECPSYVWYISACMGYPGLPSWISDKTCLMSTTWYRRVWVDLSRVPLLDIKNGKFWYQEMEVISYSWYQVHPMVSILVTFWYQVVKLVISGSTHLMLSVSTSNWRQRLFCG